MDLNRGSKTMGFEAVNAKKFAVAAPLLGDLRARLPQLAARLAPDRPETLSAYGTALAMSGRKASSAANQTEALSTKMPLFQK